MNQRCAPRCHGFTLIEAVMATLIVAILLGVALTTLGSSRAGQVRLTQEAVAHMLAAELLGEIVTLPYHDPNDVSLLGIELSEVLTPQTRTTLDDVDDYHNWSESPPQTRDGTPMTQFAGYQRTVRVDYVTHNDLTTPVLLDSGIKRIRVQVLRNGKPLATLTTIRTDSRQNLLTQTLNSLLE